MSDPRLTETEIALLLSHADGLALHDAGTLETTIIHAIEEIRFLRDKVHQLNNDLMTATQEAWSIVRRVAEEGTCRVVTGETRSPRHELCWAFDDPKEKCFVCAARAAVKSRQ